MEFGVWGHKSDMSRTFPEVFAKGSEKISPYRFVFYKSPYRFVLTVRGFIFSLKLFGVFNIFLFARLTVLVMDRGFQKTKVCMKTVRRKKRF